MITLPLSVFAVPLSLYRPFPLACKPNLGLVFKVLCFFFALSVSLYYLRFIGARQVLLRPF